MDRELSQQLIRNKWRKTAGYAALALLALLGALWLLRNTLKTSLNQADIRVAIAETGYLENTLSAAGEVRPEFEQVITSPIAAVIQEAFFSAGSAVKTGDKILELDKTFTQLEFEKQKDALELKRNGIVKIKLELDKSFFDIQIQDSIKAYRINSLKAALENARRLFKAGGGTREAIEQAETDLRVAQLEKRQLENDIRSRQQVMQASMRETQITASIQEKELSEFEQKLRQANIVASRAGVLTFVNKNLGTKVNEGEILARIADLGSFRVLGSISDNYGPQLRTGMDAILRVNDTLLRGQLINIHPAVSNNVMSFDIALNDPHASRSLLRPNMKLEVFLVTASKKNVVRVKNGPAFKGSTVQDVFVVGPDGKATRRTVHTGLSNFDWVEITSGLKPGERVIISDMSAFQHSTSIDIHP
ncbi:MAG: HlyD family efflux transporter periplasmic adaptor subunit [Saprospiraceae bacterium]|nr:HlyD family efflux transporter periplasmic adaptor subunit [Saprospiraceae bacterium]